MAASGGGYSRKPVKIVIISTQYVETDATSFKSVVQKLTGSGDSDYSDNVVHAATGARKAKRKWDHNNLGAGVVADDVARKSGGHSRSSFLIRDSSFKEFDRLLGEMPQLNGDLWSD